MKFMNKSRGICSLLCMLLGTGLFAQEVEQDSLKDTPVYQKDVNRKIDGVVAVVGDHVILDSDIDLMYLESKSRGIDVSRFSRCEVLGKLMEDKFYAHHAVQDSVMVSEEEIKSVMDNNIEFLLRNFKNMDEIVKYYRKKSEEDFRTELYQTIKLNKLTQGMQEKVIGEVEVTPEEVRTYFNSIPKDSLPFFGVELEVAQIIINPIISEGEKQKVIDRLNEIRNDVLNGASFFSKAVLYSEDSGSKSNGGFYKVTRKSPFVKEFKDVAFSLSEGEISKPFETEFGYHIIYLEKIRGQELELRHILITPKVTDQALKEAREKAFRIRERILSGEISFADAARSESDEKETKANGGLLINPETQDSRFELTRMDPMLYAQIVNLADGEVSQPIPDQSQTGLKRYKLLTIMNRYEEHVADYSKDFTKIKAMALQEKQLKEIKKWFDEKLPDTYININDEYKNCKFENNWLKK